MYVPQCAELLSCPWLCPVPVQTVLCRTAACDREICLHAMLQMLLQSPFISQFSFHTPETSQETWEHDFLGQCGVSSLTMQSPEHFKVMAVSLLEKIREGISFPSPPLIKTYDVLKCSRCLSSLLHQAPTEMYFQAYLPMTCASKFKIGKLLLNDIAQFSLLEIWRILQQLDKYSAILYQGNI